MLLFVTYHACSDSASIQDICIPGGTDEAGQLSFRSTCDIVELNTHRIAGTPVVLVRDILAYGTPQSGVELWSIREARSIGSMLSTKVARSVTMSPSSFDSLLAIAHSKGVVSVYEVRK